MEQQEQTNTSPSSHAAEEPEAASHFRVFDLASSATFRREGPAVRVLWESTTARLLLLALQEGQQLDEHRTSYQAFIQVISGHLIFKLEHERISMRAGTLLHLEPRVAHSVEALQDSLFLITLIAASTEGMIAKAVAPAAEELASEPQRRPGGGEG
ncbi:cupin domain-containing protein [Thermogemmatispora tikiterensis]|uniref:Cupin type-2 domain-containing protein n=1 Tax=Thermogemmatispora tikiterensis TaxID=1825093 RepID=A0A328VJ34_9CHLR|nr:cupin domain-containing protein [Thermogemmatispora tikiterensis]RAQ96891.1 hypothetical protein A4R35_15240 [Thermogemmatispora tikiterensis]